MNLKRINFYSSVIITIGVIILLLTGSSWLLIGLDSNNTIPLGTPLTWAGMISLPMTIYWGIKEMRTPTTKVNSSISMLLKVVITLGILWVPISYLLAGNLSFTFTEKETFQGGQTAMRWFWYLNYGIAVGAILSLIMHWVTVLLKKR